MHLQTPVQLSLFSVDILLCISEYTEYPLPFRYTHSKRALLLFFHSLRFWYTCPMLDTSRICSLCFCTPCSRHGLLLNSSAPDFRGKLHNHSKHHIHVRKVCNNLLRLPVLCMVKSVFFHLLLCSSRFSLISSISFSSYILAALGTALFTAFFILAFALICVSSTNTVSGVRYIKIVSKIHFVPIFIPFVSFQLIFIEFKGILEKISRQWQH